MVGIENFPSLPDVFFQTTGLLPWHRQNPVEIVANDSGFGTHRPHILQLAKLGIRLLARRLRHFQLFELRFQFLEFTAAILAVAELLLDRLHLLVQIILALRLLHLALDAVAHPLFNLKRTDLLFHQLEDPLKPLMDVQMLEKLLLLVDLDRQMRGDHVSDLVSLCHLLDGAENLGRHFFVEFDVLVELLHRSTRQTFCIRAKMPVLVENFGVDRQEPVFGMKRGRIDGDALSALDEHFHRAIGKLEQLQDRADCADGIKTVRMRVLGVSFFLRDKDDLLVFGHHRFQRTDRLLTADEQRHDHMRENNNIPQGKNWQVNHRCV